MRVDKHHRPLLCLGSVNRWLAFRVDAIGALVSFLGGIFVVSNVDHVNASIASLAMMYAITYTDTLLLLIRLYAGNEQNLNSVERIQELPTSRPGKPTINQERIGRTKGSVGFIDYSTRYYEDSGLVLRHVHVQDTAW